MAKRKEAQWKLDYRAKIASMTFPELMKEALDQATAVGCDIAGDIDYFCASASEELLWKWIGNMRTVSNSDGTHFLIKQEQPPPIS